MLIKPDGVERRVIGEIISRIERKGLNVVALELKVVSVEVARAHYDEHKERPFFGELVEFITSGPLVAAVVEGPRAIAAWRQLAGGTDPESRRPPRAPSAAISAWKPSSTWCTARIRRSRQPARSSSGSRVCRGLDPSRAGVWDTGISCPATGGLSGTSDVRDHRGLRCGADRQRPSLSQTSDNARSTDLGYSASPRVAASADAPEGSRRIRGRRCSAARNRFRSGPA